MKIKILYETPTMPNHMVLETPDGRIMGFFITPARHITEKDLHPFSGYQAKGKCAVEAQPYFYKMYGLEKTQN
ncbi:MAG: hypothetical protein LIO53_02095 [Oscillospiraceae bacterium]|nr:hypothetical protein [Oscillospiraceae bacterium]